MHHQPEPITEPPSRQELMRIIVREILEEKISLAPRDEIRLSLEEEAERMKEGKKPEEASFDEELKKIKEQNVKELTGFLQAKE